MALFSTFTVLWGIGGLFHMGRYDLEIYYLWESFSVWIGVFGSLSSQLDWHHWNGIGELTATGRTGSGNIVMWDQLLQLARDYPNYGATGFGIVGLAISGFFGWLLKRPMARQAVRNEEFSATIAGLQGLLSSQQETIKSLETMQRNHEKDREHWQRTRAQLTIQIEDYQSQLRPWPENPDEDDNVIIVEDNHQAAVTLCRIVRYAGYQPFVSTRGYEALNHIRSGQFKLMILDFGLPDINGLDVAIQARREGCTIPFIAVTGVASFVENLKDDPKFVEARFAEILPKTSRAFTTAAAIKDAIKNVGSSC